ncbi:hypothetical protein Bpfe_031335 [Biomphalaria pfeifferi]|uniref:Uncharacterized protein n=1 Tax=Biomphalaria pfeifferi TaxID=112525 RepID=A0AAD8EU28_BIOPF|nr:hypothetical protein Bpfe_031335 [Biomphalaria pfeifferi]
MAQQQIAKDDRSIGELFSELARRNDHARQAGNRAGATELTQKAVKTGKKRRLSGSRRRNRLRGTAGDFGGSDHRARQCRSDVAFGIDRRRGGSALLRRS